VSCFCIGPQNGQPLCPCAMRGVVVKNGRYIVPQKDLGPANQPVVKVETQNLNTITNGSIRNGYDN